MKVEEIAEAVAKLPPDQLARFRRWFTAFDRISLLKNDEPALVSAVDGAGSAMLFSVAAAI